MEKEALIDIILNDIKEVHALVNTFKGKNEINAAFINLTRTKIANISEELSLLEQLNTEKKQLLNTESSLTSEALMTSNGNDSVAYAESSSRFAEGESYSAIEAVDIDNDDAGTATKTDEETIAAAGQTSAADTQTKASEPQALKADKQTIAPASEAKASDTETMAAVNTTMSDEHVTLENDSQTNHPESESNTTDKPTEMNVNTPTTSSNAMKGAKPASKASVLGEVIRKEGASVNEAIASRKESVEDIKQIGKPVDDVRKAFGLNDRFYYQRELFSNNADLFNQTLEQINHLDSYDSAISFLRSNYNWPADNEASESFYKSIKRRFI
ncbi:hypothetical protein KDU71_06220 [Carboxylicivirga sediminis]|uniref:Uncharacterized protein n=1 Tax=Carboxylicivirga sediminis TaxID=2006564 RepID=A0A941F1N4_9BACT|nr:hypothetical protein [Carboxylicivirga sediminis]MBR8535146.1 hypothetical protein [Carboxylicivirga sediminis]